MSELRGSVHNSGLLSALFAFVALAQIQQNYFFAWWPSFPSVQETYLPQCFICCFLLHLYYKKLTYDYIMGKISLFSTKRNAKQWIKCWSNVSSDGIEGHAHAKNLVNSELKQVTENKKLI